MDVENRKKLKIVSAGYEGYNGPIGAYEFVDGVSVEEITEPNRRRLAAAFEMVEIDSEGVEEHASPAARLISLRENVAPVIDESGRQTPEDRLTELAVGDLLKRPVRPTMTHDEIAQVLEKKGGQALRELGNEWGVKHRSFVVLMQMIADVMEDDRKDRAAAFAKLSAEDLASLVELRPDLVIDVMPELVPAKAETTDPAPEDAPADEPGAPDEGEAKPEDATAADDAGVSQAARSGDLSAALNQEG